MPKDTLKYLYDSISDHPIAYGTVPSLGGVGLSFVEQLEIGLRLAGLIVGLSVGCITLYIKIKDLNKGSKKK